MLRFRKFVPIIVLISILNATSGTASAVGLDDAINYKSPATPDESSNASPYTIEELIKKIPDMLTNDGVYIYRRSAWFGPSDPKSVAFNKVNFGNCDQLYIANNSTSRGTVIIVSALEFSFPENEKYKTHASDTLKMNINSLGDIPNSTRCRENTSAKILKIKELANAIIQSAPSILAEKQKRVEAAKAIEDEKSRQVDASKKAAAKERERVTSEINSKNLALAQGLKERDARTEACKKTPIYKLYESSNAIVRLRSMESNAQQKINNQEKAAKISGIVDKKVMCDAGNLIVWARKLSAESFVTYKQLGGSARSVELVIPSQDPCKDTK